MVLTDRKKVKKIGCTSPLKALRKDNGEVVILDRTAFQNYFKDGRVSKGTLRSAVLRRHGGGYLFTVPCGRCLECRLAYAKTWSERILLEASCYDESWFITLTYDDDHLPSGLGEFSTLEPEDVTLFIKRLRDYYQRRFSHIGFRYYYCGEYGDTTFRPHYHLIGFNLPVLDLKPYSKSPLGDMYFNSQTLTDLWQNGHVVLGEVTAQSAAYTARYVQKKALKDIDYSDLGVQKEFVRMSRRPGIGVPYLELHLDEVYSEDQIYLPGGRIARPCRTFDTFAERNGVDIESLKDKRLRNAVESSNIRVDLVSRDYYQYLDDLEKDFQKRSRSLTRSL